MIFVTVLDLLKLNWVRAQHGHPLQSPWASRLQTRPAWGWAGPQAGWGPGAGCGWQDGSSSFRAVFRACPCAPVPLCPSPDAMG